MVGIGPFVTLPLIVGIMQGPTAIFAWLLGALLSFTDGMVWAELGAKWPEAGGSYAFLQKLFGKWGRFMAFLFIWQTVIQAPLVVASGAIGFSQYLTYLIPLESWQQKLVSATLILILVLLLYRNIKSIGRISIVFGLLTIGTLLWLILSGLQHFNSHLAFNWHLSSMTTGNTLFMALGMASVKSVYSYLGYYNVCHLGAEIKNPARNIPRSIFISITGIAILYLSMQTIILGILPWQQIAGSKFIVSTYFEHISSPAAGKFATILILGIAVASLFSVILGYSRVPYAAAVNGDFFPVFARVHPRHKIPHVSLLVLGGLGLIFSLLFRLSEVITAIVVVRILIQFVSQAVGLIAWRKKHKESDMPYKMPLFPVPAIISIIIWLYIFFSNGRQYILGAIAIILSGALFFYLWQQSKKQVL